MHNGFLDKRRRFLNLREMQIENVLPEHFASFYPKFVALLKNYYEWQDQNDPNELLNHLFAVRDINETDITLLSFIEDEFLLGEAYFEGFGDNEWEKRAAANFSNQLFRSKGTKFAIEWFFRSFYGLDAEVVYPKENVFTLNNAESRIGPDSLHYLTNDKLYQTFALLVRVGVPISKWRDIFKLFAHPAGMYLGAEVTVNDIVSSAINSVMQDSAATQRTSSIFSVVAENAPFQEGKEIDFKITATNLPNNSGYIYYRVDHITTSDSDFIGRVPSIDNPEYVAINDSGGIAVGRFSLLPRIDSAETEGVEEFRIFLQDGLGRTKGATTVTLNDVISSYTLAPSSTLVSEGTNVTFNVTGTNVPGNGSTTLYYYVQHITTDDDDFATAPPDSVSPAPFFIRGSTGQFTLRPVTDNNLLDDGEQFKVIIQTLDGIKKDSATITVANQAPLFNIAPIGTITEGNNLIANISVDPDDVGDTITWSITGSAASDGRLAATSGSTVLTSTNQNIVIAVSSSDAYVGTVTGTFSATNAKYDPDLTVTSGLTIIDEAPEYSILMNPSIIEEGDSATFTLTGRNIQDSTYYFYIDNITTNNLDFLGTRPTNASREAVTVTSNVGTTAKVFFSDSGETVDQTFITYMYDQAIGGTLLASQQFTIVGAAYTITPSVTSVNEGGSVTFTFTGPDGTYYYWIEPDTGVTAFDFTSGWANQSGTTPGRAEFIVSGGSGTFSVTLREDKRFEGTETFRANVATSSTTGAVAESVTITINDTSKQEYTMTIPTIAEGDDLIVNIATNGGPSEGLFYEISGAAAARFSPTQIYSLYTGVQTSFSVNLGTSASNTTFDGNLSGTVTLSRGGYVGSGGTLITTANFTLQDAPSSYTLSASTTTPNEGGTINWTIGGTSIPNGTYYYRLTDIFATSTSTIANAGNSVLFLTNTSGISIGMQSNLASVPGTVTFVNATSVTMSSPITSGLVSGTNIQFADPSVFADFTSGATGTVSVTGNAGGFSTVTIINNDTQNDVYTMGLYTTATSNTPVASVGFTIIESTPSSTVNIALTDANAIYDVVIGTNVGAVASAALRIQSDGKIFADGNVDPGGVSQYLEIGSWAAGTPVGNFQVSATITSGPTGNTTLVGSYGTALSLSSSRIFALQAEAPFTGVNEGIMSLNVTVSEVDDPSNTDTQSFTFRVEASTNEAGGGGGTGGEDTTGGIGGQECFTQNSLVTLEDGTKAEIRLIAVGDRVLGVDGSINEVTENRVFNRIATVYGWDDAEPFVTGSHPFLTTEGWKCFDIDAGQTLHPELDLTQLREGDTLVTWNGKEYDTSVLQNVISEEREVHINSLSVTGNDTYIVNGFVVHNK